MKKKGCPQGFEYDKSLGRCTTIYKHFPDWVNFQKVQVYLDNNHIKYKFDEYGLKAKNKHLDIVGEDDVMQRTPQGWDVDYSQDPECPINSTLDFFAGLYKNPKWQKEFSKMFYNGPHVFTAEEKYNMQDMVRTR